MVNYAYKNNDRHFLDNPVQTAKIRKGMFNMFIDRHMISGTNLSQSRTTASVDDLVAVSLLSVFANDSEFAELAFCLILLFHLSGRAGEETATTPYDSISPESPYNNAQAVAPSTSSQNL